MEASIQEIREHLRLAVLANYTSNHLYFNFKDGTLELRSWEYLEIHKRLKSWESDGLHCIEDLLG